MFHVLAILILIFAPMSNSTKVYAQETEPPHPNYYMIRPDREQPSILENTLIQQAFGEQDSYGYYWNDSAPYEWIDASSGTDATLDYGEWVASDLIMLPFTFEYYGEEYTDFRIASGYLALGDQIDAEWWPNLYCDEDGCFFPHPAKPNAVIAGLWTPLHSQYNGHNGHVYYMSGGTAPNRFFVVQFDQMPYMEITDCPYNGNTATFEIILFENGSIKIQYDVVEPSCWVWTVGIENPGGSDGLMYQPSYDETLLSNKSIMIKHPDLFMDVMDHSGYLPFITKLYNNHVTSGCGSNPLRYCPFSPVTRAQMAVFLLTAKYNGGTIPLQPYEGMFTDVPESNIYARFIEQLAREHITSGCGGGNFCPEAAVTRDQMAVFLLTAKYGSGLVLDDYQGRFGDVPGESVYARFIEKLASEGVTSGCGGGNYCPTRSVIRQEMAVFLSTNFDLP